MTAILKAGDISPGELPALIEGIGPAGDRLIWAEGVDGWSLDRWNGLGSPVRWHAAGRLPKTLKGIDVLRQSPAGRIFAPGGEIKWRLLDAGRCRLVFLGDSDWLPGVLKVRDELDRLRLVRRPEKMILWGQQTDDSEGDWVELRIPHRFRYPAPGEDQAPARSVGVVINTEVWSDRWGEPHFVRLSHLDRYPIEEG